MYIVGNIYSPFFTKEEVMERGYDAVTFQRTLTKDWVRDGIKKNKYINGIYNVYLHLKSKIVRRPPHMEEYRTASRLFSTEMEKSRDVIPTVMPQWDHTPRSGWTGALLVNAAPRYFKEAVKKAIETIRNKPEQERIIFIKSWNEWGEGNYMEPDLTHGRGYIDALKEALDEDS